MRRCDGQPTRYQCSTRFSIVGEIPCLTNNCPVTKALAFVYANFPAWVLTEIGAGAGYRHCRQPVMPSRLQLSGSADFIRAPPLAIHEVESMMPSQGKLAKSTQLVSRTARLRHCFASEGGRSRSSVTIKSDAVLIRADKCSRMPVPIARRGRQSRGRCVFNDLAAIMKQTRSANSREISTKVRNQCDEVFSTHNRLVAALTT